MRFYIHPLALAVACLVVTSCGGPDYVKRYDKPLPYAQARREKASDFPLPPSSHDIYHGEYVDWVAYTRIVRFEAPVADCLKHLDVVMAWDDKRYSRTSTYSLVEVTRVDKSSADALYLEPAPWFAPDTIKHGLYTGKTASHEPEIWIDLDNGVFYFREAD